MANPQLFESVIEGYFYYAFIEKFPTIQPRNQVWIGRFRVDFLFIPQKLVVECDGKQFHNPKKDQDRDRKLVKLGYRTLRFPGSQIYKEVVLGNTTGNTGGYNLVDVVKLYLDERGTPKKLASDNYILQRMWGLGHEVVPA